MRGKRTEDPFDWDEPLISHADARMVKCPRCHAKPPDPCVTVGVPRQGMRMELHHPARYVEARKLQALLRGVFPF